MNKITLENFRCFREKQEVRLAPLTLLVGENSTGKTSFMALIRALWDVAFDERIPNFKEEPYDLGSFDEIAHHRGARGSRANTFESSFTISPRRNGRSNKAFHYQVTFQQKGTAPIPVKRRLTQGAVWMEEEEQSKLRFRLRNGQPQEWEIPEHFGARPDRLNERDRLITLSWLSMFLKMQTYTPKSGDSLNKMTGQEAQEIRSLTSKFEMLYRTEDRPNASAPVRSSPRRTYDPASLIYDPKGDYIPMYLAYKHFHGGNEWKNLKSALENFGKESGLFDEFSIKRFGKSESAPFQLQVRKSGGKLKGPLRNLIDVGYGVSQALPVITELLRSDAPNMFLMQQPEVHLHPSAQAALGSLFCERAGAGQQLVVETHSDYLLDRVRMDVRDDNYKLKPDDVSILYFERKNIEVQIHSLRLDEQGQVVDAPPSYREFFMEEMNKRLKL